MYSILPAQKYLFDLERSSASFNVRQSFEFSFTYFMYQSELVGDVAVPVSVRQAVLFCALRNPDASPRLNWRNLPPPSSARYVLNDLDAASISLEWAICRLVEHGNDLRTSLPGLRGQTT